MLTVIVGTPDSGLESWGQQLADDAGGICLSHLRLTIADTLGERRQMSDVAQEPLDRSWRAALATYLPEAAADLEAFLEIHQRDSVGDVLGQLRQAIAPRPLVIVDDHAGFRIHEIERWFALAPDALFVHAVTPLQPFVAVSIARCRSHLFVPPDYRDHNAGNAIPQLNPSLAWYQVHTTLGLAFSTDEPIRRCRLRLPQAARCTLKDLSEAAATGPDSQLQWPYRSQGSASAPALQELEQYFSRSAAE